MVDRLLRVVLQETPHETDCSVSVEALKATGNVGEKAQAAWLGTHRPPKDGKDWYHVGEHWEYTSQVVTEPRDRPISLSFAKRVSALLARAEPPVRPISRIVVKPLMPLNRAHWSKPEAAQ